MKRTTRNNEKEISEVKRTLNVWLDVESTMWK